jgi:hypothetical protein
MSISSDYVDAHVPWLTPDLQDFLEAIGAMFAEMESYAFGNGTEDEDELGWSILLDVDRVPVQALPDKSPLQYLAQFVGETVPVGISEAAARQWVRDRPNSRRGTVGSLVAIAQRHLTGSKLVAVRERDGDEDHLAMRTLSTQTADSAALLRALLRDGMPADIVLDYQVFVGATLGDLDAGFATLDDIEAAHATLSDVVNNLVGYDLYTES